MPKAIELAGETVTLCPERAMYWERTATLFIADAHFGKAATFRSRGVFVPHGTTEDNLARLDALIGRWQARRVVFLGDLYHARQAQEPDTQNALLGWRERNAELELSLVAGNHDRHAGRPAAALKIEELQDGARLGPFALRHHPEPLETHYVLAGHLHPGYRLAGRARESARLPCFWFGEKVGVLPAFGAFTGALTVRAGKGERIYLAGPSRVLAIPGE